MILVFYGGKGHFFAVALRPNNHFHEYYENLIFIGSRAYVPFVFQ